MLRIIILFMIDQCIGNEFLEDCFFENIMQKTQIPHHQHLIQPEKSTK